MNRAAPLAALLALVALPRHAEGGISWEDGPVKLSQASRPVLTGKVLAITWVGNKAKAHQRLPSPRPLGSLGQITPPPGDWDTVVLHLADLNLDHAGSSQALPLTTLEIVLTEPVQGGAPLQLTLELSADDLDLAGLDLADLDLAGLQVALQDAASLTARPD